MAIVIVIVMCNSLFVLLASAAPQPSSRSETLQTRTLESALFDDYPKYCPNPYI